MIKESLLIMYIICIRRRWSIDNDNGARESFANDDTKSQSPSYFCKKQKKTKQKQNKNKTAGY